MPGVCNGYPCFVVSIAMIGVCTAIIGDVAGHLGCFIFLKDSVNAIAFVALGTSVPGKEVKARNKRKTTLFMNCGSLRDSQIWSCVDRQGPPNKCSYVRIFMVCPLPRYCWVETFIHTR